MEFVSDKDQYKAVVVPLDDLIKMVRASKIDGLLINMKSKCALPCGEERFAQVDRYREWKAEHAPEAQQEEAVPETLEAAADGAEEAPADTPFVPIVNKNNE